MNAAGKYGLPPTRHLIVSNLLPMILRQSINALLLKKNCCNGLMRSSRLHLPGVLKK
jgi:hypothetical protein